MNIIYEYLLSFSLSGFGDFFTTYAVWHEEHKEHNPKNRRLT